MPSLSKVDLGWRAFRYKDDVTITGSIHFTPLSQIGIGALQRKFIVDCCTFLYSVSLHHLHPHISTHPPPIPTYPLPAVIPSPPILSQSNLLRITMKEDPPFSLGTTHSAPLIP